MGSTRYHSLSLPTLQRTHRISPDASSSTSSLHLDAIPSFPCPSPRAASSQSSHRFLRPTPRCVASSAPPRAASLPRPYPVLRVAPLRAPPPRPPRREQQTIPTRNHRPPRSLRQRS